MTNQPAISRVTLRNYKSIARCSVGLRPLIFLVGPNGAGKSNFLDALRFVAEALNTSLDHALRDRGGIGEVRRRSAGHPTHFGIRLDLTLDGKRTAHYAFQIGAKQNGGFEVQDEECRIFAPDALGKEHFYRIESGNMKDSSPGVFPPTVGDRLYLVAAAGLPEFRPVYDCLARMGFYNLNPEKIRDLQPPDSGELLLRDGANLAAVLDHLPETDKARVVEFLSKVVPGVMGVDVRHVGKKETLEFRQTVGSNGAPWRFMAESMSDGTLRALGILTALFQSGVPAHKKATVVGIEEPESALHPGAAGILRDALREASRHTQVLVTSHSPDLLDNKSISDEDIIAVEMRNGETLVAPVDAAGRSAIGGKLYTAGELLRMNQLNPDDEKLKNMQEPELFGKAEA
ncbi:MAG: AAA family ATPase [Elusimicrobia bacterium]|nr:AAA family ATPase [Elusimicrobiota bacterium]